LQKEFADLAELLRQDADEKAAEAVSVLLELKQ
jgi:hypothetical protein